MSFLSRRSRPPRHRDSPHADLGVLLEDDAASIQAPSLLHPPSVRSTTNIRKRFSNFSLLSLKRGRSQQVAGSQPGPQAGVGFVAPYRMRSRSRSPSPEPSLEIRRPSGLGRRASVIELLDEHPDAGRLEGMYGTGERKRSISTPELRMLPNGLLHWTHVPEQVRPETPPPPPPPKPPRPGAVLARMPADLIKTMLSFAAPADVASTARVNRLFLGPARAVLYEDIDLAQAINGRRTEKCINLLASRRDLAELVHRFTCDAVPAATQSLSRSTYSVVTLAIALNNMSNVTTLTLPRFDASFLSYTSFRLRKLTFLCEHMSNHDIRSAFEWLESQPSLTSLSFPRLVLDESNTRLLVATDTHHEPTSHSREDDPAPLSFTSRLLPALAAICGPASLVTALAPGRPLTSAQLHIHSTIYDGLRPSALVSALSKSSSAITRIAVIATAHGKVDARTLERVLMSVGSELGSTLQVLEVDSLLEEEALLKLVGPVLPRYKTLHTLRLYRRGSALPSPPPTPLAFRRASACYGCAPPSTPIPEEAALPQRAAECTVLAAWSRHCASLRAVVFPSGAEWAIAPAPASTGTGTGATTGGGGTSFTLKGMT